MKKSWISIKRGFLQPEHRLKMGIRVWLYMYIVDQADWDTGKVMDWRDKDASDELEMPLSTLRQQRQELESLGYIGCLQSGNHQIITINKWIDPRSYSGKVMNDTGYNESNNESNNKGDNKGTETSLPVHRTKIPNTKDHKDMPIYYQACDDDGLDLTPAQELKLKQKHPAYIAFYHVTKKRPNTILIDRIISKIGDFPDQSKLESCFQEWIARGYNQMNTNWLDWYTNGIPGYGKNNKTVADVTKDEPEIDYKLLRKQIDEKKKASIKNE